MSQRSGPFWDAVAGRRPVPPAAATLGWEFVDADTDAGTIEVAFTAPPAFADAVGNVLGGFVAAMLYDTMGPALIATLERGRFLSTLDLTSTFLVPARPGRFTGFGRVLRRRGDIAFLDGALSGPDGVLVATGTATAQVVTLGAPGS